MTTGSVRKGAGGIASGETAWTNSYVYGLDLSGSPQRAGTIGGLLACTVAGGDDPGHCVAGFYAYDANGNVTDLVGTNGTALAHYEYDPFGNPVTATGPLAMANPFRFSTKYTDDETGLLYYGYRYYSPELGRWLSRDPTEERGGLNILVLNANNAVCEYDIYGFFTFTRYPGWNTKCPASYVKDGVCELWAKRVATKYRFDLESQLSDEYGQHCPVKCEGAGWLSDWLVPTIAHMVIETTLTTTKSWYHGKLIYGISSKSITCNMLTVCIDCCGREYIFDDIDTQVLDPDATKDDTVKIVVNFTDVPGLSLEQMIKKAGGIQ